MKSYKIESQIWKPFLQRFVKYIHPSVKKLSDGFVSYQEVTNRNNINNAFKLQKIKNFYWFGARMSGKTWNTFKSCLALSVRFRKLNFSIIVCRLNKQDLEETFKWFSWNIPNSIKGGKNFKESHKLLTIEVNKNLHIQFIHIFGYHRRQKMVDSDHFLKGYTLKGCDVRMVIVEEADKLPKAVESALNLICRNQTLTFNFFIFNNYVKDFPMVKFVEENLPWNPAKMGFGKIKDDVISKFVVPKKKDLQCDFWDEITKPKIKSHFWRLSVFALIRDKKILNDEIDAVWSSVKNDPAKKATVLFGKPGNPKASIYSPILNSVFFENTLNWIACQQALIQCYVGVDMGYSQDKTAVAVVFVNEKQKRFFVHQIKTFESKSLGPVQKYRAIAETIKNVVDNYQGATGFKVVICVDAIQDIVANVMQEIGKLGIRQTCDYRHYGGNSEKPKIIDRVNKISYWIQNQQLTFNKEDNGVTELIDEMDTVQWFYNIYMPDRVKTREGKQDAIEALENALFFFFWNC